MIVFSSDASLFRNSQSVSLYCAIIWPVLRSSPSVQMILALCSVAIYFAISEYNCSVSWNIRIFLFISISKVWLIALISSILIPSSTISSAFLTNPLNKTWLSPLSRTALIVIVSFGDIFSNISSSVSLSKIPFISAVPCSLIHCCISISL